MDLGFGIAVGGLDLELISVVEFDATKATGFDVILVGLELGDVGEVVEIFFFEPDVGLVSLVLGGILESIALLREHSDVALLRSESGSSGGEDGRSNLTTKCARRSGSE